MDNYSNSVINSCGVKGFSRSILLRQKMGKRTPSNHLSSVALAALSSGFPTQQARCASTQIQAPCSAINRSQNGRYHVACPRTTPSDWYSDGDRSTCSGDSVISAVANAEKPIIRSIALQRYQRLQALCHPLRRINWGFAFPTLRSVILAVNDWSINDCARSWG